LKQFDVIRSKLGNHLWVKEDYNVQCIFILDCTILIYVESLCRVRIAFTLGIDATKLVKCWKVSTTHCILVRRAYPNHYISLEGLDKESVATWLHENQAGKHGTLADEVKVCILVFQCVAPEMSPYLVLIGRPQIINKSSNFGSNGMQ
jgi:hypothetical protein